MQKMKQIRVYEWKTYKHSEVNKITWRIRKLMLRRLMRRYFALSEKANAVNKVQKPGGFHGQ